MVRQIQLSKKLTTDGLEVWLFDVDVLEGTNKRTFTARTDTSWGDFKDQVIARLDAVDVRLVFRLNVDSRAWSDLSCEADLTTALTRVSEKALVARTREVSMEVKNVVSVLPSVTNDVLIFFLVATADSEGAWRSRKGEGETNPG